MGVKHPQFLAVVGTKGGEDLLKKVVYIVGISGCGVRTEGFIDGVVDKLIILLDKYGPSLLITCYASLNQFDFRKITIFHWKVFS
jgi:hypothetical protein